MWRDDAYILDMLLSAREAREMVRESNAERFAADRTLQLATMHLIQTIGEAARLVSPDFKAAHPEIPWAEINGMRNKLVHEYFRILPEKVWEVVERDLPSIIDRLEPLAPKYQNL